MIKKLFVRLRGKRTQYQIRMTVITSNYEREADDEIELDPTCVMFDGYLSSDKAALAKCKAIFEHNTASGFLPAEFRLYSVGDDGTLTPMQLPTPTYSRFPFICHWKRDLVDVIRGAA